MTVKKYSVNLSRQIEILWPTIALNIFTILIYFYIIGVEAPLIITISFFGFFFVVNLLPILILHIQYLIENKGVVVIIDKLNKKITYKKGDSLISANFSDIEGIYYYNSYGRGSWYTFGEYEFCKIKFFNNNEIILTSLIMDNIKDTIEDLISMKVTAHSKFLPFLPRRVNVKNDK